MKDFLGTNDLAYLASLSVAKKFCNIDYRCQSHKTFGSLISIGKVCHNVGDIECQAMFYVGKTTNKNNLYCCHFA